MHEVSKSTLQNHIHDAISKIEASQNMQQLSPGEEEALAVTEFMIESSLASQQRPVWLQ